ncbi:PadR family transcriptional regulator [Azospirillum sp. ST 5-10]|uniref:PadR family transcriptional regulator n=1 Tax=unclassified Azospirillum TaxID=2630922 RepID=UPI003F4A56EA
MRIHMGHWDFWHHAAHAGRGGGGRGHRPGGRGGFGQGGPEGFGRGGRVFGPGDLRLVLLALIAEQPRHGYELIKEIEQRFGGAYAPSPGSVYPTLTLLEELGYVRATVSEGAKRLFEITEEGGAYLAENRPTVDGVMARMELAARAMTGDAAPDVIREAMHTLRAALHFHRAGWSDAETERVRTILERATRAITGGERADE